MNDNNGKVLPYNHNNNLQSRKKTIKKIIELINYNFSEGGHFITLNCTENITETSEIKKMFGNFWRRLKYRYKNDKLQYLYVIEKQKKGRLHIHLLLKTGNGNPFKIGFDELKRIWGNGGAYIESVIDSKGLAKYVTKEFHDNANSEIVKAFWSREIKLPPKIKMTKGKFREKYEIDYYKRSTETLLIVDANTNNILNVHTTEIYKKKHN